MSPLETEGHRLLNQVDGLFAQLPEDVRHYDPSTEQLTLSFPLFGQTELINGIIIEPSSDHTRLNWSVQHDGSKIELETEPDDFFHVSPLTTLQIMYFGFLKGTGAELYFDYEKAEDPPDKKFLVIKPSPDCQQQIRFSVGIETTFHGNVTVLLNRPDKQRISC